MVANDQTVKLRMDMPEGVDPWTAIEVILERRDDEESGYIDIPGATVGWSLETQGGGVQIDRRQRLAAAALLMAFDLPQEMSVAARSMIEATDACPGMTTGEMPPMNSDGRRAALEMAKGLVEDMLAEIEATPALDDEVKVLRVFRLPADLDEQLRRLAYHSNITFEALVVKALSNMLESEREK